MRHVVEIRPDAEAFAVTAMCDSAFSALTEQQLVRAYTRLFLVPKREDGSRRISLACFGNYEVLIVELADAEPAPRFWMELYARDIALALDSCACDDLEQASIAAEGLMEQARKLHEKSAGGSKSRH
jgi:hypothetical protein